MTPRPTVDVAERDRAVSPVIIAQAVEIHRAQRWQRRRDTLTVCLPRAILGGRVVMGLRAFPFALGLVAVVGYIVLVDLGVHGAVPVTACGIAMGAAIGVALMLGGARGAQCADGEGDGDMCVESVEAHSIERRGVSSPRAYRRAPRYRRGAGRGKRSKRR